MVYQPDLPALDEAVEQGFITRRKHPEADLWLYNYTRQALFGRHWTPETRACRGLILDSYGTVIARPFEKFFNLGEEPGRVVPDEPFEVYEKLDGALGILYWLNGRPRISTRSSFTSRHTDKANALLAEHAHLWPLLDPSLTYLFEIIFPDGRIVVDYGQSERLVLLAVIETATGREYPVESVAWPDLVVRHDGFGSLLELADQDARGREGYVVHFQGGLRLKIKFETYRRLHRLITGFSTKAIWELLKEGEQLAGLDSWNLAPGDFHDWALGIASELQGRFDQIEAECLADFCTIMELPDRPRWQDPGFRKWFASQATRQDRQHVLFALLNDKPYQEIIWKELRPMYAQPFKTEDLE